MVLRVPQARLAPLEQQLQLTFKFLRPLEHGQNQQEQDRLILLVSRVEEEEVLDELPLGHKGEGEVLVLDTQHEQASLRLH
jgi:hypothetical protein